MGVHPGPKAVGIFGKLHQGFAHQPGDQSHQDEGQYDDEVKSRFFFFSDRDMGTSRFLSVGLACWWGIWRSPASAFTSRATLAACLWGFFLRGGGQAVEEEDGFEQIAVYDQVQLPLLQRHEGFGDVQPQTAALGVPGAVPPGQKRSMSSSAGRFNSAWEMFFTEIITFFRILLHPHRPGFPAGHI